MAGNSNQIYLDHAATTPMVQPAITALTTQILKTGNASSLHSTGRSVRKELEEAREAIAKAAGCVASEVIFTGSGTEANNLAVKGLYWLGAKAGKKTIITSTFEHHAVMDPIKWLAGHEGATVVEIPVSKSGEIYLDQLKQAVEKYGSQTALISVMHANNEIGTVQPIAEIVKIAGDIPVHTDAVQSFGKIDFNFASLGVTAATISAHKVGGPLGVAALILRKGLDIEPVLHGGGQERDIRSGTFNAPGIIAFAAAAIAKRMIQSSKHEFLFPGKTPEKPISENTMIYALYRLGYHTRQTVHGFRGLASTWANEQLVEVGKPVSWIRKYHEDWVELQLAHSESNEVRGAYNAAEYLAPRRHMMQDWADFLSGGKVVNISKGKRRAA